MDNNRRKEKVFSIGNMTKISIFAALAGILMLFKFPIPLAPPFMTIDFGDVATLMSGFILGPVSGVITVVLKNILNLILNGTTTAYVGEVSNIIVGSAFVYSSAEIYKRNKTRKGAALGLIIGILLMSLIATFSNYFVIFPIYAKVYGIPVEGFVDFMPKNNYIHTYMDLILLAVVPFNLIKGSLNAILTFLTYKKVSTFFKNKK